MRTRSTVTVTRTAGLLLVAFAWALLLTVTGSPEAILFTVPVFLLAAPLALGRYVGEEILVAARSRPRRRSVTPPAVGLVSAVNVLTSRSLVDRRPVRGPPLAAF